MKYDRDTIQEIVKTHVEEASGKTIEFIFNQLFDQQVKYDSVTATFEEVESTYEGCEDIEECFCVEPVEGSKYEQINR